MKMLMLKIMSIISILMPIMKTPMSMGSMLMVYTMLMTMFMNKINLTSWFPMITFLMMIGGMMILFMYMSSIASNEKFKMNLNMTIIMLITMIISEDLLFNNQMNENESLIQIEYNETKSLIKLYNKKSMLITTFLVMFLLLTMISVSKIVLHYKGPLRMKTYE